MIDKSLHADNISLFPLFYFIIFIRGVFAKVCTFFSLGGEGWGGEGGRLNC